MDWLSLKGMPIARRDSRALRRSKMTNKRSEIWIYNCKPMELKTIISCLLMKCLWEASVLLHMKFSAAMMASTFKNRPWCIHQIITSMAFVIIIQVWVHIQSGRTRTCRLSTATSCTKSMLNSSQGSVERMNSLHHQMINLRSKTNLSTLRHIKQMERTLLSMFNS